MDFHDLRERTDAILKQVTADFARIHTKRGAYREMLYQNIQNAYKAHALSMLTHITSLENKVLRYTDYDTVVMRNELEKLRLENKDLRTWRVRYRKHTENLEAELDQLKHDRMQNTVKPTGSDVKP